MMLAPLADPPAPSRPPVPHDPCDREAVILLGGWEVRVSTGSAFEFFVPRGLWHVQLWHPIAQISILTPSRLTAGKFEAFPSRGWKARCATYQELSAVLRSEHDVTLPSAEAVTWIRHHLVDRLVAAAGSETSPS
ncbi:MAG: hypothetical protein J0I07_06180 [Myxococcales bacterium]|nr:hypothetical protein [Myxococcales bacterium]